MTLGADILHIILGWITLMTLGADILTYYWGRDHFNYIRADILHIIGWITLMTLGADILHIIEVGSL